MPTRSEQVVFVADSDEPDVSLLDVLDSVLNQGIVVQGSVVISIAGVDLIYVGLNAVLTSVETAMRTIAEEKRGKLPPR
jgi:gas vesicle protein GvpA/GvpJ/GvpM family